MKYYYCYNTRFDLFQEEINYAKELDVYIFYNEELDSFYDKFGHKIDIKDKIIFPRSSIKKSKKLVSAIINHQGIPLMNNIDFDTILNWPYYIKTIRKNMILSGKQIIENPELIKKNFDGNQVFFKTKHKNYSSIININKILGEDHAFQNAIQHHQKDDFIISDAISIENDEFGSLEYRAFIIEGEIYNISRISHILLNSIPKEVIKKIINIVTELKSTDFPSSYVLDIFIYRDNEGKRIVDVLECNPIIASGTYLYNSIFEKSNDLEHQNRHTSIPKEKNKYSKSNHFSYNQTHSILPTAIYNLQGGFAADLLSFTLYGTNSSNNENYTLKKVRTKE